MLLAFLDASHDFYSVGQEVQSIINSGLPFEYLIFDDYTAAADGVGKAVQLFVDRGELAVERHIGETDYNTKDGRRILGPEGIICRIVRNTGTKSRTGTSTGTAGWVVPDEEL